MCGTGSTPAAPKAPPPLARAKQVSGASLLARAQRGQFSENDPTALGLDTPQQKEELSAFARAAANSPLPTGKQGPARRGPLGRAVGKIF